LACSCLAACGFFTRPGTLYEDAWRELNKGNLEVALEKADRGLQLFHSADSEWFWRFRVLKAETLVWQHRNEESLALSKADLPVWLATSDLAVWRRLSQCVASAYIDQSSNAHRFLDDAETIAKAYHPELLGQVELRRGTVFFREGAVSRAQTAYRQALQLARVGNDRFLEAAALGSMGMVTTKQEHYDESLDWNRAALQLSQGIGAQSSVARILGNMAWSFQELGDYENALANYREAEEAAAHHGQIGDRLYWRTGVATMQYVLGNSALAESVLVQALDQARHQDDKSITTEYLNDLATLDVENGKADFASAFAEEAAAVEQKGGDRSGQLDTTLLRGRVHEMNHRFNEAESCFRALSRSPDSSTAQRWEAEARLGQLYDAEGKPFEAETHYRRSIQTIQAARQSVAQDELRLSFLSSAIGFYDDYISFLIRQQRIEDALRVADLTRSQTLAEGLGSTAAKPPPPGDPRDVAKKLQATVLVYWVGRTRSSLWVVAPAKVSYFPLPGRAEINSALAVYRQEILDGRDVLTEGTGGTRLYNMLVAPARGLLPPHSRTILLPAENLYGLNFETLIVPEPHPHFWIEDVTLSTANSLSSLWGANQRAASKRGNRLLLIGNPEPPSLDFPRLPQAAAEVAKISAHFPESQRSVLQGRQATVSAYLRSNPGQYSYVHFATHGISSHRRPLESAVILSKEAEGFKLYAREIVAHPLNAQLVTISACNAAGTRAFAGEGLVGLSWAFLRAGARNVIATLWEVNDASSTTQLMDDLYKGLERGDDPAVALRNAKLLLLKSNSDTVFRKPVYWAPFQLYAGS
jgi:CHAT domain-containing protein/tetratricopeptide (TPR) repeat protein